MSGSAAWIATMMPEPLGETRRETSDSTLAAVIVAAQQGDRGAMNALILANQQRVVSVALRLLGHREDARDAAQEVLLRLFAHLHRFDATRPLGPWLYRVTVNVCRDLARRRRKRAATSLEADAEAGRPHDVATPAQQEDHVAAAEERRWLALALRQLTENERTVIVLRDIEGLSTEQVARVLGARETTVRTHLCRGRLKLRALRAAQTRRTA
jgi:RNA polymerase sigma-70 factor, ECF subfamily